MAFCSHIMVSRVPRRDRPRNSGEESEKRRGLTKYTPCAPRIINFMNQPGSHIFMKVRRCILSLYDSSRSVSIHPLSLFMALSDLRWRSIPATMPARREGGGFLSAFVHTRLRKSSKES